MPKPQDDPLLRPEEVAPLLNVARGTLYRWRHHGEGPTSIRVGGGVRYRKSDVDAYIVKQAETTARGDDV
ncbi:helix-turn-helix domain-containing protein [Lentzea sp. NBRC 105346]|uniref:helix-turn-helix transcriptional regulator n=1 Tax=Lentzea sp. NBRC 105346 TaxID=3032205 RepID=UPI0025534CC2|nr:helix-turn-helix domain-containing protein [Lentzea sp. NBRC 105346]